MSQLKLLTFDLDDTLWPVEPVIHYAESVLFQWLCEEIPGFTEHYDEHSLAKFRRQHAGQNDELNGFVSRKRQHLLRTLLASCGLPDKQLQAASEQAFAVFLQARQQVTPYPGVVDALDELSRKFQLCAISNGNADICQTPLAEYFSGAVSAESCGFPKPDARIFNTALAQYRCRPDEAVHIGDHPEVDVAGALSAGLRAVWFNPHRTKWPLTEMTPNAEIHTLEALTQVIYRL